MSQEKSAQTIIMNRSTMSGPSIIRIVPSSSKKVLPVKRNAKPFVINTAKSIKLEVAPSTSSLQVQSSPHKEDHRYGGEEVEEFEVIAGDSSIAYVEDNEDDIPKQVFIPVQQSSGNFYISTSTN